MKSSDKAPAVPFSPYQKLVVGMLAFLQFALILDFMLMAPLGAVIMPGLAISPTQFGLVVSAYAFSAGISGVLMAGFADRFDRKKILLFFYSGFVIGTLWCGLANSFEALLLARVFTGLFGGVIGSIVLAIATDLFAPQIRGRVMGLIQTAFAASQVLGIPIGLYLSNHWDWHMPFLAMAGLGLVGGVVVAFNLKPVDAHLGLVQEHSPWMHLWHTVAERRYWIAFATTTLLTTGGFMLMPFSSAFSVHNLGVDLHSLPTIYLVTGLATIFAGPLIGKASDAFGRVRVFAVGSTLSAVMMVIYANLTSVSVLGLIIVNVLMFVGIFSRMIPYQAMVSALPAPNQRGSFNAISASIQQLSGGLASVVAGHIVSSGPDGKLLHVDVVAYVVVATAIGAFALVWRLQRNLTNAAAPQGVTAT